MIGTHPLFFILYALVLFRNLGINLRVEGCPVFQHHLQQTAKAFCIKEDVNQLHKMLVRPVIAPVCALLNTFQTTQTPKLTLPTRQTSKHTLRQISVVDVDVVGDMTRHR